MNGSGEFCIIERNSGTNSIVPFLWQLANPRIAPHLREITTDKTYKSRLDPKYPNIMTLIATMKAGPSQILLGDLLISGEERLESPLNLPGLGSVHQVYPEGSGYVPIALRQKVCLLNDYLAVAWAGPRYNAQAVIRELSQLPRPITIGGIRDYFSKQNISRDSAFICMILDEIAGKEYIVCLGTFSKTQTSKFGEVSAAGTGLNDLGGVLEVLEKTNLEYFEDPQYESPRFVMIQSVARVTSILQLQGLGQIDNGRHSLLNYYGGGFEAVYICEGRLRKLDNICYHYCLVKQKMRHFFSLTR